MNTLKEIQSFLDDIPGPSPWYLVGNGPSFSNVDLKWMDREKFTKIKKYGHHNQSYVGKTVLLINEEVKMILDFQCYVQKVSEEHALIWFEQVDEDNSNEDLDIVLLLIDLPHLSTIHNPDDLVKTLNRKNKIGFIGIPTAKLTIRTNMEFGMHSVQIPQEFKSFGEILILAKSKADGQQSNYWDKMSLALFILNCETETLEIVAQDWFNNGAFDFMYQWATRIKREPNSKRIYGDGIRIGAFKLTADKRQVEKWYN